MVTFIQYLASVFTGGVLVRLVQIFFIPKKQLKELQLDEFKTLNEEDRRMRAEMLQRITDLEKQVKEVRHEVDEWREKYFKILKEHSALQIKYSRLKAEFERLRKSLKP